MNSTTNKEPTMTTVEIVRYQNPGIGTRVKYDVIVTSQQYGRSVTTFRKLDAANRRAEILRRAWSVG